MSKQRVRGIRPVNRFVSGNEIDALKSGLGLFEEGEKRLKAARFGSSHEIISPVVALVPGKTLNQNYEALGGFQFTSASYFELVRKRVPELARTKQATAEHLFHDTSSGGRHYMHLVLDEKSTADLRDERIHLWHFLEGLAETKLSWKPHTPVIDLAEVSASPKPASREELLYITDYIKEKLPMQVTLDPVYPRNSQ